MGAKYYIKNPVSGEFFKTNAQTFGAANKRADKLDAEYGRSVHNVIRIQASNKTKKSNKSKLKTTEYT